MFFIRAWAESLSISDPLISSVSWDRLTVLHLSGSKGMLMVLEGVCVSCRSYVFSWVQPYSSMSYTQVRWFIRRNSLFYCIMEEFVSCLVHEGRQRGQGQTKPWRIYAVTLEYPLDLNPFCCSLASRVEYSRHCGVSTAAGPVLYVLRAYMNQSAACFVRI
jgi:hypothetical protein